MEQEFKFRLDLQFFAKDGPGGEKTEPASSKKLEDARKEGQTAKSKELINAVSLMTLFITLKVYVATLGTNLIDFYKESYALIQVIVKEYFLGLNNILLLGALRECIYKILLICIPIFVVAFIIAFLMNVVQQKWMITAKPMIPKLSKISPISGFKRMFSGRKVVDLLKNIAEIVIISYVVYDTMKEQYGLVYMFYEYSLMEAVSVTGNVIINLGIKISAMFLVVGIVDLFYQRHKFSEDMKMTKQEVKDEYKNTEGDPHVKGQIRRRMQEASRRRMMHSLPEADVVITNPTHFAVALKYDADSGRAPYVLAKGADYVAMQIKEKARELDIEIVENKPLARLIYHNVEIGDEIPQELYQAVAEVLAFVYKLKNKI